MARPVAQHHPDTRVERAKLVSMGTRLGIGASLRYLRKNAAVISKLVGPGGYDIYGVKFANGFSEFRLLLGTDGKADDVLFRPDGNDAPGGVVGEPRRGPEGIRGLPQQAPLVVGVGRCTI